MITKCPVCAEELEIPNDVKVGARVLCESCNQYFSLADVQAVEENARKGFLEKFKMMRADFANNVGKIAILSALLICLVQCIFVVMLWKQINAMDKLLRVICKSTVMIENDVSSIESDVSSIESDVSSMRSDVSDIETQLRWKR